MNLTFIEEYDKKYGTNFSKQIRDIIDTLERNERDIFYMYATDYSLREAIDEIRLEGKVEEVNQLKNIMDNIR